MYNAYIRAGHCFPNASEPLPQKDRFPELIFQFVWGLSRQGDFLSDGRGERHFDLVRARQVCRLARNPAMKPIPNLLASPI